MAENNQTNTAEIVRERANTSSKNTIVMLPDIIRAYHEIGLLSDGERDEVNGIKSDSAKITYLKNKIRRLTPEHKLNFCDAFVGDDLTNFHGATPAILAFAYRAAYRKAQEDEGQKDRLQKIAAHIDDLSADFASSSGMIVDGKVVDTTNVADVYDGFADMLKARMGDLDAKDEEKNNAKRAEMEKLGVALDESKINQINNNFDILESAIGEYDDIWGLSKITSANASKLENRWDKLDFRVARAELWGETKEVMARYKFLDDKGDEIPQFKRNGRKVLKDSRMATIVELARHNVIKRHAGKLDEEIDSDALEEEFNDEVLFLLWNMKTQGQNVETSMDDPEIFMDYTKRDEILDTQAYQGGEISDKAYSGMLFAHTNATAGWLARIKNKAGVAAQKDDMDRFFDKASSVANMDALMKKRMELFKRILKGFASAFIASALITTIATAAAATAGISLAAGLAITGFITALGMGLVQYHRWKKAQQAAGLPTDLKTMLSDPRMLTALGTSAIAVIAMVFGVAGMAQAAMICGYGALALGGTKNAVELYRDARNANMSVVESLAWSIAGAGAIAGGGFAGRAAAHGIIDWVNHRWPENTTFQQEVHTTKEHTITGEIEHSKTVTNYPDGMVDRAEAAVRSWYAQQYPDNPEVLQQHIDAVNQYNADYGTDYNPWTTLRAMALCDGHSGYGSPGWMHHYGYTPEQINSAANAIYAGGYDSDGMAHLIDLQMNHMDAYGHIGRAGSFTNQLYSDLGPTPSRHTITWNEPYTETVEIPVTRHEPVHAGGMAMFGNFNPRDRFQKLRERVGSFVDRIRKRDKEPVPVDEDDQKLLGPGRDDKKPLELEPGPDDKIPLELEPGRDDKKPLELGPGRDSGFLPRPIIDEYDQERVLWVDYSLAKRWKNAHEQLKKAKTKADKTRIQQEINHLRNLFGHATDEEIDRGVEFAELHEEQLQIIKELKTLRAHKPDVERGATKWDVKDWEKKQAQLVARFKELDIELAKYDVYHKTPDKGVQAKKKEERREQAALVKPVVTRKSNSKYPMSDKVEEIIKNMPTLDLKVNRDSLANIQQSTAERPYPPVKALCGVFTWSHDIGFATNILEILPDMAEREQLLKEALDYYKANYSNDGQFFDDWIVKDLGALVYDGTITLDVFNALREYYDTGRATEPVQEQAHEEPKPAEEPKQEDIDWSKYQSPFVFDHDKIEVERPYDLRDKFNLSDNMVRGFNMSDMIKKPDPAERSEKPKPTPKPKPVKKEKPKPKAKARRKVNTLIAAVEEAYGKLVQQHEGREYHVPATLEDLANEGDITQLTIGKYNGLPFSLMNINNNGNPFVESEDGPVVLVNWQGIVIPFVQATGMNTDNPVTPGKWYPVSNVQGNGHLWTPSHIMEQKRYEYEVEHKQDHEAEYGMLMQMAGVLDDAVGDIRNYKDIELTRQYHENGGDPQNFVGGCDVIPTADSEVILRTLGNSVYYYDGVDHSVYGTYGTSATRDKALTYRALNRIVDQKWFKDHSFLGRLRRGVNRAEVWVRQMVQNAEQSFNNLFGKDPRENR